MIIRERPNLWQVIFTFRNTVIERIYPQIVMVTVLSIVVVVAHRRFPEWVPVFNGAPFALLGVALSIFLGFRNSACYDRWWEARKHWGDLIAVSRDLARQTLLLQHRGEAAEAARALLLHLGSAFAHALADHLRRDEKPFDLMRLLPDTLRGAYAEAPHKPVFVLREMGEVLAALRANGTLDAMEYGVLDGTLRQMNAALAACERLRNTPVPFGYTLLLLRTAYMFCFLVPFGFADVLGWTTPIAAAVFAYTLFGLDALGDELEEPFGTLPNDLPIRALALDIEVGLRTSLGEVDLPTRSSPVRGVLL